MRISRGFPPTSPVPPAQRPARSGTVPSASGFPRAAAPRRQSAPDARQPRATGPQGLPAPGRWLLPQRGFPAADQLGDHLHRELIKLIDVVHHQQHRQAAARFGAQEPANFLQCAHRTQSARRRKLAEQRRQRTVRAAPRDLRCRTGPRPGSRGTRSASGCCQGGLAVPASPTISAPRPSSNADPRRLRRLSRPTSLVNGLGSVMPRQPAAGTAGCQDRAKQALPYSSPRMPDLQSLNGVAVALAAVHSTAKEYASSELIGRHRAQR